MGRWRRSNTWHLSHAPPAPGQQEDFTLPVSCATGWIKGPVQSEDELLDDLRSVDWVGVYIRRHGDIALQDFQIDDLTVRGMFYLNDDDTMSNFAESRAGTHPRESLSFFRLYGEHKTGGPVPVELKWDSISDRTYRIWRGTNAMETLEVLEEGVDSTPFVNLYEDLTATNSTIYLYRVEVE